MRGASEVFRLPVLARQYVTYSHVRQVLLNRGAEEIRQNGSHVHFDLNGRRVTVPNHGKKDLAEGTLSSIVRQSGIDKEEFKNRVGRHR